MKDTHKNTGEKASGKTIMRILSMILEEEEAQNTWEPKKQQEREKNSIYDS